MIPSVPSEPTSRSRRLYPALSLVSPASREITDPVGEHSLEPRHPCGMRSHDAARAPRQRRRRRRRRSRHEILRAAKSSPASSSAARAASRKRGERRSSAHRHLSERRSTFSIVSRRVSEITTSPLRGTPPPTSPVFPPWGTVGPACAHALTTAEHLGGVRRPHDEPRPPDVATGVVALVGGTQLRVGDDGARPHGVR